jgi:hypothetical protein
MEVAKEQHVNIAVQTRKENDERHARLRTAIENIAKDVGDKLADQETRLRSIENLKWWLLGAIAIGSFVAHNFDLSAIMG